MFWPEDGVGRGSFRGLVHLTVATTGAGVAGAFTSC